MSIPKKIYLFWHTTTLPFFIDKCYKKIIEKNPTYDVILYDYNKVINIPELPENLRYQFKLDYNNKYWNLYQNMTDWLRLFLLYKYGGYWVDITTIFFDSFDVLNLDKSNLDNVGNYLYGYNGAWSKPIMENWFLASKRKNKFVKLWLHEVELLLQNKKRYNKKNKNFIINDLKNLLPYLSMHLAFLKLSTFKELKNHYKYIGNAQDKGNPLYIQNKFNWNIEEYIEYFLTAPNIDTKINIFVKIRGNGRDKIINRLKNCDYSKHAYFIKYLDLICKKNENIVY